MLPSNKTRTTTTRSTRAASSTKSAKAAANVSPDDLADKLASKLNISDPKGKARATEVSSAQRKADAMRAVNSASKGLSAIVESGWKATEAKSDRTTATAAVKHATTARKELGVLRELSTGEVDVERAASSVVGKLVSLEMCQAASGVLQDMRAPLVGLYHPDAPPLAPSPPLHDLLSLPLHDGPIQELHLYLISSYLLHALTVTLHTTTDLPVLLAILHDSAYSTLLTWTTALAQLPDKQYDNILTRAYSITSRFAARPAVAPRPSYSLRIYSLLCLAHTRPSVIAPNTFWEQALKYTATFAKTDVDPMEGAQTVLDGSARLVAFVQKRDDRAEFMSGIAFARFCEYWGRFAKQAGDLRTLERITRLTQGTGSEPQSGKERAVIETSALCTILAKALAVFEAWQDHATDIVSKLQDASSALGRCGLSLSETGDDHDRVKRGVERLRRAVVKIVEAPSSGESNHPAEVRACARAILEQIVDVLCEQRELYTSNIVTGGAESLFALARTAFVLNNPDTYALARTYLARAAALVSNACAQAAAATEASTTPLSGTQLANYTRCVAGAYYNFAVQLHQSGRISHAVPFLDETCKLSERALADYRAALRVGGGAEEDDGKKEVWKQLEEQAYRRWELLGVCHAKTGDRQLAFEAFTKSIAAFPFARHAVAELAAKTPPATLLDASQPLKHLAALVDRVTYMAACELFHAPEAIPVAAWPAFAAGAEDEQAQAAVAGVLMERQLCSLEECRWKQGVGAVLDAVLDSAARLYERKGWAVRRARVLMRRLELGYCGEPGQGGYEMAGKIQALLSAENVARDGSLARFAPELLVSAYLWLAAHAHKARDSALSSVLVGHVEEACKVLKGMIPPAAPRQSLGKSPREREREQETAPQAEKGRRTMRTTRAAAATSTVSKARTASTRTRTAKTAIAAPVTPRKRRGEPYSLLSAETSAHAIIDIALDPVSLNTASVSPSKSAATTIQGKMDFDDFGRLVKLIQMVSHLVGLVGHVLARIKLLNAARRLTERHTGVMSEVYVSLTIDTAHEYVKLGRPEKSVNVLAHLLPAIRSGTLSQEIVILFLLRFAEAQALTGEVLKASMTYCDAVSAAADFIVEEKGLLTVQRIRARAALLERAAEAALSYAAIQDARDDPSSSLEGLLQALRLWNRAIDTLSRLQPSVPKQPSQEDNPFEVPKPANDAAAVSQMQEPKVLSPAASRAQAFRDSSGWRLAEGLLSTLLALSQAYEARGSAREAEFFAQQTRDLAEALHAPVMVSRALAQQGGLQIHLGQLQEGHAALMQAAALVVHLKGPDAAEIRSLQGRYSQLSADKKGAQALYEEAMSLLDELGGVFATLDGGSGARKSLVASPRAANAQTSMAESVLAPTLLARLLRHHITLLHEVGEEYNNLLQRFAKLPQNAEAKAEEIALRAKLTLDEVYSRFRADMFLSSLAESAMTIPMGMSGDVVPSPASQDMLETLATAEKLFWEHIGYIARRGHVSAVREAAICLALIRTFRTSLGRGDVQTPVLAAQLLDISTVTTLRREMLDVIRHKFLNMNAMDDLQWPLITPNGSPLPPQPKTRQISRFSHSILSDSDDDEPMDDVDLKTYWEAVAKRYEAQCFDAAKMSVNEVDQLPPHWTVVNVSVTEDRHTMFVTRQRAGRKPLIFCLPLKGRREGQEDENLTYEDAIEELREIIRLSDEGTRQAAGVKKDDRDARMAWWKTRSELDERLRQLLGDIEFCWLGAFKTIFIPAPDVLPEDLTALRTRLDSVFKGSLVFHEKKPKSRLGLDDGLLECFSTLAPDCRDEELEDLVYFILDLYQFHGVPVAISEVDMDQVVVELRTALEEHAARLKTHARPATGSADGDDDHIFLVLDKNVQGLPWESLPVLRGRSVSRVPSVGFVLDRLEFAHWRKWEDGRPQAGRVDRAAVDPRRTFVVLNPSGDLRGTEGRFGRWLGEMRAVGWDGVVGRAPSEQQFVDALTNRDLVIYFGHGGAEQYIRSHKIRHLPRCAATMLWGCSSGVLKYMGDFDRTGTPNHYMLAGCPTLVANLWDVTDRDIDKFSQSVFDDLHLNADAVRAWGAEEAEGEGGRERTSVVRAVAQARESCKLKYLTGAAPVVYGIPFYL